MVIFNQIKLDVCNGLRNIVNNNGKKPTIRQGTCLTVSYNHGFLIDLEIQALLTPPTDKYIGIVRAFRSNKEKYDGLTVGDNILFKEENIYSIGGP